jgi:hypothetical protein
MQTPERSEHKVKMLRNNQSTPMHNTTIKSPKSVRNKDEKRYKAVLSNIDVLSQDQGGELYENWRRNPHLLT